MIGVKAVLGVLIFVALQLTAQDTGWLGAALQALLLVALWLTARQYPKRYQARPARSRRRRPPAAADTPRRSSSGARSRSMCAIDGQAPPTLARLEVLIAEVASTGTSRYGASIDDASQELWLIVVECGLLSCYLRGEIPEPVLRSTLRRLAIAGRRAAERARSRERRRDERLRTLAEFDAAVAGVSQPPMALPLTASSDPAVDAPEPTRDLDLHGIASRLPPRDRQVFDDMLADLSIRESAEKIGISKSLVGTIRQALRALIRSEFVEACPGRSPAPPLGTASPPTGTTRVRPASSLRILAQAVNP